MRSFAVAILYPGSGSPHVCQYINITSHHCGVQVADIGHCMLPRDQHKFWVGNLETEFFKQGDLEKEAKLSISPLMDRAKPGPSNGSNQVCTRRACTS